MNRNCACILRMGCYLALGVLLFTISGCGAVSHSAKLEAGYAPRPDLKIRVVKATDESGVKTDFDKSELLTDALKNAFEKDQFLCTDKSYPNQLIIESKIVQYDPGNAFKRWLLPGWGSTVLTVHCDLMEPVSRKIIGTVDARRTIAIGGLYTIGAWETIFGSVAHDVVSEVRAKTGGSKSM